MKARTRFLTVGIFVLALIVFGFVLLEVRESGKELEQTLTNESNTLIETLNLNIENSILTNNEIEDLLVGRLNAVAAFIGELENVTPPHTDILMKIGNDFDMSLIAILDEHGNIISSNFLQTRNAIPNADFTEKLQPVINGSSSWAELGVMNEPVTNSKMYLIARKRMNKPGCIITGYLNEKLLGFRKKIGIGKQIQDIGKYKDIVYIVLQDEGGIFTASKGVREINSISDDSFLQKAMGSKSTSHRIINYNGREVFEVVKPLVLEDSSRILNRLGISLDNIRSIQQRSVKRATVIGIGLFLTGLFMLGFVLTRERFAILKEEHKKIQTYTGLVLENMADGVIAADSKLKINIFNRAACEILSIPPDFPEGKSYEELFPDDELMLMGAIKDNLSLTFTEVNYHSSTQKKIIGLSISIINKDNGMPDSFVLILRDLTVQKHYQQQLERKEKLSAMGELAGGVAHEIRNPLNAINIIAQRFQYEFEPVEDPEEYGKLVRTIRSEVARVNNIIKQFLDFSRPSKLDLQKAQINDVLDDIIALVESQALAQNIIVRGNYSADLTALIDKEKMKQVFLNLIQNAIDAIKENGLIVCSAFKDSESIIIEITDNGSGIPQELQSKIFNLYFTTKTHGTGLGLSIVHQIITEHGGDISIESEPGSGTKIKISLPAIA